MHAGFPFNLHTTQSALETHSCVLSGVLRQAAERGSGGRALRALMTASSLQLPRWCAAGLKRRTPELHTCNLYQLQTYVQGYLLI